MKTFMPELPVEQRVQLLRDHADQIEVTKYLKDLTQEELDVKREQLSDNLVKLSEWEDELTDIKDGYKVKMKPKKDENRELLQQIKTRKEEVEGTVFHLANHEDGMMETYDENGELIGSRRLRPEEKQPKLFPISKAQ